MAKQTSLSVLVPVYNEQYLVATSLDRLRVLADSPLLERIEVIVVDDCSRDQTAAALERFRASAGQHPADARIEWHFLRHERNRGKGAAIRTALADASCELAVIHDADLEYHPGDLLKMIPLFFDEHADAVYGSRFLPGEFKRALFFRHELGNKLLTFLCDLVSDLNLTDMETCYKMVRTPLLRSIPIASNDFRLEPELTIKLAKRGARIFEVPIRYSGRTYQEGKKIGWKDGVRALGAIAKFAVSADIYRGPTRGDEMHFRLKRARRYARWLADTVRPCVGERVLELGAGSGNLSVHLFPRTLYWAVDDNPLFLVDLEKLIPTRPYLRVSYAEVTRPDSLPDGERFDTVICVNILEHVEDDAGALARLGEALDPGGRAIVLVPNAPGLLGSLDRTLGHRRRYTRGDLEKLGQAASLRLLHVTGLNRISALPWWVNGKLLRRKSLGAWQLGLFDLFVPLFRLTNGVTPLPSLSLVAVFEKPADAPR
jgi:glycosyltransferase involved in cell wall biosynthesis